MVIKSENGERYFEIDVKCLHITPAGGVLLFDGDNEAWFPKQALEDWPDKGKEGTALIEEGMAIEKGFV